MYLVPQPEITSVKSDHSCQTVYNQIFTAAPKQFKLCQLWNNIEYFPLQAGLKKERFYCNPCKWKTHGIKLLPGDIAKWIMDKQCQRPPSPTPLAQTQIKIHQRLKVYFSLVWNFPTGWVPGRKKYPPLLYMWITFTMTIHSRIKFFSSVDLRTKNMQ